jgi:hypothetical protein
MDSFSLLRILVVHYLTLCDLLYSMQIGTAYVISIAFGTECESSSKRHLQYYCLFQAEIIQLGLLEFEIDGYALLAVLVGHCSKFVGDLVE